MPESLRARLVQMACDISNQLRDVAEIDMEQILQQGTEHYLFVDVRPAAERDVSMIPGAITADEFAARQAAADERPIVAYCTAGYRSGVFAQQQRKQSDRRVLNLRGGILSWCDHQQPLTTASGEPTHRVHVYAKMWNLVSEPYEGVW